MLPSGFLANGSMLPRFSSSVKDILGSYKKNLTLQI